MGRAGSNGGWPQFSIGSFTDFGNAGGSGGPIYYDDRQYQYAANVSWVKGKHTFRFGFEWGHQNINHFETSTAPGHLTFGGGVTTTNDRGAPASNQFNNYGAFLLGLASSAEASRLPFDGNRVFISMPTYRLYAQDQWQVSRRLTLSIGVGWNYFPMSSRTNRGMERLDFDTLTLRICGVNGFPHNCGYDISKKYFSPSLGVAYRPTGSLVIRTGFALNYDPLSYSYNRNLLTTYPEALSLTVSAPSTYLPATTLSAGIPAITIPDVSSGVVTLPKGFSAAGLPQSPRRDYFLSWNFTVEKQLPFGLMGQAGYVATRGVGIPQRLNINAGQVIGAGAAGQPFNRKFGTTATLDLLTPVNHTTLRFSAEQADSPIRQWVHSGHGVHVFQEYRFLLQREG